MRTKMFDVANNPFLRGEEMELEEEIVQKKRYRTMVFNHLQSGACGGCNLCKC